MAPGFQEKVTLVCETDMHVGVPGFDGATGSVRHVTVLLHEP